MPPIVLRPSLDEVRIALEEHAVPLLKRHYRPDCCIAASRIVTTVLHELGYPARPTPCWALAVNAAFVRFAYGDNAGQPDSRSVAIDDGSTEAGRYPAHLVVITGMALFDLSAGQFHRPAKGIVVPSLVTINLETDWKTGPAKAGRILPNGAAIVYERLATPPRIDYRTSPDWTDLSRTAPISRLVLTALDR